MTHDPHELCTSEWAFRVVVDALWRERALRVVAERECEKLRGRGKFARIYRRRAPR